MFKADLALLVRIDQIYVSCYMEKLSSFIDLWAYMGKVFGLGGGSRVGTGEGIWKKL